MLPNGRRNKQSVKGRINCGSVYHAPRGMGVQADLTPTRVILKTLVE